MKIAKALTIAAISAGFFQANLLAQPAAAGKLPAIPRAADGKPDLSGVFSVTGGGRGGEGVSRRLRESLSNRGRKRNE